MSTTVLNAPNPQTPMAWLPPDIATRLTLQIYIEIGTLTVLLWDIILHIPQDYAIMKKRGFKTSTVVYIIARLSSLAYVLSRIIVETAPIGNCDYIRRVNFLYPVALPFTVLLLVFRVVALYKNDKYVVAFFSVSWLAILAVSIVVSLSVSGMPIRKTGYCIEIARKKESILGAAAPVVHDTLIFVPTTWMFMKNSYMDTNLKNSFNIIILGKHLPAFSRSILRDGQLYFLTTIIVNLILVALYSVRLPYIITPCTFAIPSFVLINTMSCHLYRNVQLGIYRDFTFNTAAFEAALGTLSFSDQQNQMGVALSQGRSRHSTRLTQEINLEAARDDSNFDSREKLEVVESDKAEPGNSKGMITEKAEV